MGKELLCVALDEDVDPVEAGLVVVVVVEVARVEVAAEKLAKVLTGSELDTSIVGLELGVNPRVDELEAKIDKLDDGSSRLELAAELDEL